MARKAKETQTDPDAELLQRIRDRRRIAIDSEGWREACLEDLIFCDPKRQWPEEIRRERAAEGRPCLTVDRIGAFWHQLVNDFRQNKQSIRVLPVGDGADQKGAERRQGLIRHIEYDSSADIAYDTAFEGQGLPGFGFVRVYTEFESPESFDQVIKIGMIPNQFMVHVDPGGVQPDGSDLNWAFIDQDYTADEFKETFPDSKLSSTTPGEWKSIGDKAPDWITPDSVRVSEYFERNKRKFKVCKLQDGTTVRKVDGIEYEGIVSERESWQWETKWYKTNGYEIMESTDWLDESIPVVPFYGETLLIDGKITRSGIIRRAKDPAMLYNLMKTAQAEAIALTPKAPFVGPYEARRGFEKEWANANRKNADYLPYNHTDQRGNPIPKPERQFAEANIQAITVAMQGSEADLKASAGMYDANLGNKEGSQSGIAIRSLAAQGQTGNFHFQDNFNRSLRQVGRIINNLIPKIYNNERILRIIKEDDSHEILGVNGAKVEGQEEDIDLSNGRYDVVITAGPSYATKRSENLAVMMDLAKVIPGFAEIGGDLIVSQMDTPIARQIQERLKKALPPQFQEKKPGQAELPPEVEQKMGQYEQMIDQMTEALNRAQDQLDQKTLELDVKRDVALIQQKTELIKVIAQMEGQAAHTLLAHELQQAQASIDAYGFESGMPGDPTIEQQEGQEQGGMMPEQPMLEEGMEPMAEPVSEEPIEPLEPEVIEPTPQEVQGAQIAQAMENQSIALGAIAEALTRLSAPKRLVTDKMGRPVGVETVSNG